ncbi:MAG: cyanophycin synthetase [Minisyncoccia bacterium]|jgi:UDP-N-acetylmuramoylalanine--D-glutamate ligase
MSARDFFLGKRIAVIGLGVNGEMAADVRFLVKANALVSVYDLKAEAKVSGHAASLRSLGLANFLCGSVPADDLLDMDLIILSHEYPRNSSFLSEARKKGVEIEYPETLFLRLAPPITVVGIMGACGKATVLSMLSPMMEAACAEKKAKEKCFTADPESDSGILAHLGRMKNGDILVLRIAEQMMPEITALDWSPHIAVFATMPSLPSSLESPFGILVHQTYNNHVIGSDKVIDAVRASGLPLKGKMLRTKASLVPEDWLRNGRAPYDQDNAALALQAAKLFGVSNETAKAVLSKWKPLKGRLEPVKKLKSVEFWNDTASVSPEATVAGMEALAGDKNLVLIMGGSDRGADYHDLYAAASRYAHALVVLPGSGTLKERQAIRGLDGLTVLSVPSVEEAVRSAMDQAHKGDKVLFSPGFGAGGIYGSRAERGDHFIRAVRAL